MEGKREPGRPDKIQELIFKEKEAAERNFETLRFETGLFERIRNAEAAKPATGPVSIRKPVPILALTTLLLIIAGFLFFRGPSPRPFERTVRAMSAVLGSAGEGRLMKERDSTAQSITTAEYTDFGWAFKGVLYACQRESLGNVDLVDAFSRFFLEEARQPALGWDGGKSSIPRGESLNLRTEEDYQMFFTGFLKKFEEV